MSKKISEEIIDLVDRWSMVRVAYPVGWSEERFVMSEDIRYRTYLADNTPNAHKVIELKIKDLKAKLTFWTSGLLLETSIANPVSSKAVLEALKIVYTESTSIENIAEGKIKIRKEIAELKTSIEQKLSKIKDLKAGLDKE